MYNVIDLIEEIKVTARGEYKPLFFIAKVIKEQPLTVKFNDMEIDSSQLSILENMKELDKGIRTSESKEHSHIVKAKEIKKGDDLIVLNLEERLIIIGKAVNLDG